MDLLEQLVLAREVEIVEAQIGVVGDVVILTEPLRDDLVEVGPELGPCPLEDLGDGGAVDLGLARARGLASGGEKAEDEQG